MKNFLFLTLLLLLGSLTLSAQCKKCHSFEDALYAPEVVKELKINSLIHGVKLDTIPEDIAILCGLEVLYLTDHDLTNLPEEIGQLHELKKLSLAGNQLTDLPEDIYDLRKIKEIVLFGNNFDDAKKKEIRKRFRRKVKILF